MRFGGRGAAENLDERNEECKGFAGTGGGVHGNVFVAAEQGYSGGLNRRTEIKTGFSKGIKNGLGEWGFEVGEPSVG